MNPSPPAPVSHPPSPGSHLQRIELCKRTAARPVALAPLRSLLTSFLRQDLQLRNFALAVHLVGDAEITRLNTAHLRHAGVTDVLAFDYRSDTPWLELHGEVFACVTEAIRQAPRFGVPWPEELLRYIIHGILHLQGYRDDNPTCRRRMKSAENRWLQRFAHQVAPLAKAPLAR